MSLLRNLSSFMLPGSASNKPVHPLLAQAIGEINCPLISVPGYAAQLIPALESAYDYYSRLAAEIPGPYDTSLDAHGDCPVLGTMFPSAEDITVGLGMSLEVKDNVHWYSQQGHDHLYALLGTRQRKWNSASQIDSKGFTDHTFRSLGSTELNTRSNLRAAAFSRLLKEFGGQVSLLHRKRTMLRADWTAYSALETAEAGGVRAQDGFVLASEELKPEKVLRGLIASLHAPEEHLRLLTRVANKAIGDVRDEQEFKVMQSHDRREWVVCIARISCDEAKRAIEQERHSHRYLFI